MPTLVVAGVLALITGGSAWGAHRANHTEERRLLNQRASEIALILASDFEGLQTQITTVAAETELNGADVRAFRSAADTLTPAGGGLASQTGLAKVDATGKVSFLAITGSLAATPGARVADLLRRTAQADAAGATSLVIGEGSTRDLGLAHAVGLRGLVVYEQLPLDLAGAGAAATTSPPFHELDVALYAAPTRDPAALILTANGNVPTSGAVATASAPFGADTWTVAIHATSPLTGSLAANGYWLILATGALLTAVLGFLVEILLRRRDSALGLVAERTEALEESVGELEVAQEKLLQATRLAAIGQLASAIGHELRNPLGVITNAHYLLRSALGRPDGAVDAQRHLNTAEREVGAATLIVSDLLDYARAREPVIAPVDIPDLLDEAQSVMPPPPEIAVVRRDDDALPRIRADRDQLRQVLLNLLSNAYEAMPEGGTVTIITASREAGVRVRVSDTGMGMDDQMRSQLFEPFFTGKTKGIGLGLSVVKRIVDAHHGAITVESEPGNGTTFEIDLPGADSPGQGEVIG